MKTEIVSKCGLRIVLDSAEIFPNDPGQGTPAMVLLFEHRREVDSGTFWCAVGEGELSHNGTQLTDEQSAWLNSQHDAVESFIEKHSPVSEKPCNCDACRCGDGH